MSRIKCGGHCCEGFFTCYSPSEWQRWSEAFDNKAPSWKDDKGKEWAVNKASKKEVQNIADMLILISEDKNGKRAKGSNLLTQYRYTCKHFNKETRLCTNYKNRPNMCKGYPENTKKPCQFANCQCK